jgi:hypothetical protein
MGNCIHGCGGKVHLEAAKQVMEERYEEGGKGDKE